MKLLPILLNSMLAALLAALLSASAVAQDIDFSEVTVSSNLEPLIDFDIRALSDGVTITPYPTGFAVESSQTPDGIEGYAEFRLTENFDLNSVKIWNGIDGPITGFKNIYFEFFNENDEITYKFPTGSLGIDPNNPDAQLIPFESSKTKGVLKVHIHFADAPGEQLGMAEVTFQGTITDNTPPRISFTPATLALESSKTGSSTLRVIDDGGIPNPPIIQCTNGGSFTGSTFIAPIVTQNTTSICTATATDTAGNTASGSLTVSIRPELDTTKPELYFTPETLTLKSAETGSSNLKVIDDGGIPNPPVIKCTEGGSFTGSTFTAPAITRNTTSVCTATATDVAGNTASSSLTVSIQAKPDTTKPVISFSPKALTLNLETASSATSKLTIIDDGGIPNPPIIECTKGGSFTGSTFTAPAVTQNTTSVCTATAADNAGNTASGTLTVSIQVKSTPPVNWMIAGLVLTALALITIIAQRIKRKTAAAIALKRFSFTHNMLIRPENPHQDGVIFPQSPLLAGAVAPGPAPLAPAGQMVPSGLQTLTGQYAALKPAYLATGRIGGPQEGVPTNDDVAFGTGFLITPNHVMTNQHVYEFYKHYLTGPECGGIEFIAERDRDASNYMPFNGQPPLILPELDIAIFTLAHSVTDRKPIKRIAVPTEELSEREVITVSYPCPFEVDEHILSVVEEDPIFAVKRLSQGLIFRHSTDTDTPFGVQVSVDERINAKKSLSAICHNASTLGGSSGAPVLDRGGNLVGVHFAGDRAFNGEEAANLAMAIEMLAGINPTAKGKANIA